MSHFGGGGEDFYRAQAAVKFIANDEIDERAIYEARRFLKAF
jgi:hypothetical protein